MTQNKEALVPFRKILVSLYEAWCKCELSTKEYNVLQDMMFKANITTGVAIIPSTEAYALELKVRGNILTKKDIINDLTKILNSLKQKKRIWFQSRMGTAKPTEIYIHNFPLNKTDFTDFSHMFQQNPSRTFEKDPSSVTEVENLEQSLGQNSELYKDKRKSLLNSMSIDGSGRTQSRIHDPQIDRLEIDRKDRYNKTSSIIKLLKDKSSPHKDKEEKEILKALARAKEKGITQGQIAINKDLLEEFFNEN